MNDWVIYLILFTIGLLSFGISTVTGGGGALIQIPLIEYLLGPAATAPVINLGAFIGRPSRLILFWKSIDWSVSFFYLPPALLASFLAGRIFAGLNMIWLKLFIGLFLVSTLFQYGFGKKKASFPVKRWYFIVLGFIVPLVGTLVGGMGPVLNPFYLNYGLTKENLIATKTANSFFVGIFQIGSYSFFGLLSADLWIFGLTLGLGATLGNFFGKKFLSEMKEESFRKWVIAAMVITGGVMVFQSMKTLL